ncbi:septum formation inhibitor Maf [Candidatus Uhrbacteria bacterium]|nr:septum formation inhibitor Maf [Candidatus Uhrbacteria bacterium]
MKTPQPLILASSSPRRRELLERLHIQIEIHPADVDETPLKNEDAKAMVLRLAKDKAAVIARQFPGRWVLASDTTVAQDGKPIGKPTSEADARRTLKRLQGKKHQVYTAICLQNGKKKYALADTTDVVFRKMTDKEIAWYVKTGEPMDKAGSYAIQGIGGLFVKGIRGSYSNVMGLPTERLVELLKKAGILEALLYRK